MRKTDQEKPLKIAIVGEDADCKAMMDLLCDDGCRKFGVELIGVGVVNPRRRIIEISVN